MVSVFFNEKFQRSEFLHFVVISLIYCTKNIYMYDYIKLCIYMGSHVKILPQGWTFLRIVRLPGTTESNCRTTELPTPLVREDK